MNLKDYEEYNYNNQYYQDYLEYLTSEYETEKAKNVATNTKFQNSPNSIPYYSVKMASDMRLNDLHSEISMLNKKVEGGIEKEFIGAALIVKYEGRINILETGTDPNFEFLEPKHFLFYKLITEYKKRGYSFFDMNGITGDFSERNPYYGLNKFNTKVNDNNKITEFMQKLKEYEKLSIIVVDDAAKIKTFNYETWFTQIFSVNDGIWIGRGITDQNLLRVSSITKEMTKELKNDMGYIIQDNMATLCKFIDFVTTEEGGENNGE